MFTIPSLWIQVQHLTWQKCHHLKCPLQIANYEVVAINNGTFKNITKQSKHNPFHDLQCSDYMLTLCERIKVVCAAETGDCFQNEGSHTNPSSTFKNYIQGTT